MFKRTTVSTGVLLALGSTLLVPGVSYAQETQRIEITGSAIRRIDAETALPVVVLKKEDIERSGATSTVDLLQRLSTIQGGSVEANSVGGSTYGFSGVSIHDIGETRTLVLLNGHRLAQFGGQTLTGYAAGFDLNSIPVSAIERVEVLTDGASALYGADAIAGVVNFITKRDFTEGDVTVGYSSPKGGAKEKRISFYKGFGSLAKDGWNLSLSFGHDERTKLDGVARSYAKTGNLVFSKDGTTYRSQNYSASAIPANVLDPEDQLISPTLIANGVCPANTFRVTYDWDVRPDGTPLTDDFCGYDYVSTLEIYPVRKRDSGMASLTARLGEVELFADLLVSRTTQISRIAGVPGAVPVAAGTPFHDQYVLPLGITDDVTAYYRVADLGKRTSDDQADFLDLALGARGAAFGWDYSATFTHSRSKVEGAISGYPGGLAFSSLINSGLVNPFVGPGEQTAAAAAALDGINYRGYFDGGVAKLSTLGVQASREVMRLPAGPMALALGAQYQRENFESKPSPFAQGITTNPVTGELCTPDLGPGDPGYLPCDQRFGDPAASPPYSAKRNSYGVFGELNVPVMKGLETTFALRHDKYSDFGNATTGKASFRWAPSKQFLLRGSIGTGYHAPSVPQVKAAPQSYGVTEDPYTCTPELLQVATSLGAQCQPGNRQYDVVAAGNPELKPEKSKQATIGLRFEPAPAVSFGADLWWVGIKDAFGQLSENEVFADPIAAGPGSWTTVTDIVTGVRYLAWNAGNLNLGKFYSSGLDLDISGRTKTGWGDLTSQFNMTYMIRSKTGSAEDGYSSTIGNNYSGVQTWRWKGTWRNSMKMGAWTHTLGLNFRSGYKDTPTDVEVLDAAGNVTGIETVQLEARPYYTADWQTRWDINKMFSLNAGVLNIADVKPPFVLTTTGGQQVGYDGNLYDPRGRTWYINGSLKF